MDFDRSALTQALVLSLAASCVPSNASPAYADDNHKATLLEENDSLYFNSDKHYTQGLRFSDLAPDLGADSGWNGAFDLIGAIASLFGPANSGDRKRRYA